MVRFSFRTKRSALNPGETECLISGSGEEKLPGAGSTGNASPQSSSLIPDVNRQQSVEELSCKQDTPVRDELSLDDYSTWVSIGRDEDTLMTNSIIDSQFWESEGGLSAMAESRDEEALMTMTNSIVCSERQEGVLSPFSEYPESEASSALTPLSEYPESEASSVLSPLSEHPESEASSALSPLSEHPESKVSSVDSFLRTFDSEIANENPPFVCGGGLDNVQSASVLERDKTMLSMYSSSGESRSTRDDTLLPLSFSLDAQALPTCRTPGDDNMDEEQQDMACLAPFEEAGVESEHVPKLEKACSSTNWRRKVSVPVASHFSESLKRLKALHSRKRRKSSSSSGAMEMSSSSNLTQTAKSTENEPSVETVHGKEKVPTGELPKKVLRTTVIDSGGDVEVKKSATALTKTGDVQDEPVSDKGSFRIPSTSNMELLDVKEGTLPDLSVLPASTKVEPFPSERPVREEVSLDSFSTIGDTEIAKENRAFVCGDPDNVLAESILERDETMLSMYSSGASGSTRDDTLLPLSFSLDAQSLPTYRTPADENLDKEQDKTDLAPFEEAGFESEHVAKLERDRSPTSEYRRVTIPFTSKTMSKSAFGASFQRFKSLRSHKRKKPTPSSSIDERSSADVFPLAETVNGKEVDPVSENLPFVADLDSELPSESLLEQDEKMSRVSSGASGSIGTQDEKLLPLSFSIDVEPFPTRRISNDENLDGEQEDMCLSPFKEAGVEIEDVPKLETFRSSASGNKQEITRAFGKSLRTLMPLRSHKRKKPVACNLLHDKPSMERDDKEVVPMVADSTLSEEMMMTALIGPGGDIEVEEPHTKNGDVDSIPMCVQDDYVADKRPFTLPSVAISPSVLAKEAMEVELAVAESTSSTSSCSRCAQPYSVTSTGIKGKNEENMKFEARLDDSSLANCDDESTAGRHALLSPADSDKIRSWRSVENEHCASDSVVDNLKSTNDIDDLSIERNSSALSGTEASGVECDDLPKVGSRNSSEGTFIDNRTASPPLLGVRRASVIAKPFGIFNFRGSRSKKTPKASFSVEEGASSETQINAVEPDEIEVKRVSAQSSDALSRRAASFSEEARTNTLGVEMNLEDTCLPGSDTDRVVARADLSVPRLTNENSEIYNDVPVPTENDKTGSMCCCFSTESEPCASDSFVEDVEFAESVNDLPIERTTSALQPADADVIECEDIPKVDVHSSSRDACIDNRADSPSFSGVRRAIPTGRSLKIPKLQGSLHRKKLGVLSSVEGEASSRTQINAVETDEIEVKRVSTERSDAFDATATVRPFEQATTEPSGVETNLKDTGLRDRDADATEPFGVETNLENTGLPAIDAESIVAQTESLSQKEPVIVDPSDNVSVPAVDDETQVPSSDDRRRDTVESSSMRNVSKRKHAISLLFKRRGRESYIDDLKSSEVSNREEFVQEESTPSSTSCTTPTEAIELDVNDFVGGVVSKEEASSSSPSLNTEVDGDAPKEIQPMLISVHTSQTSKNISETRGENAILDLRSASRGGFSSVDSFWQSEGTAINVQTQALSPKETVPDPSVSDAPVSSLDSPPDVVQGSGERPFDVKKCDTEDVMPLTSLHSQAVSVHLTPTDAGANDSASVPSADDETEVPSSKNISSVRNLTRRKRAVSLLFKRHDTDPAPSSRVDELESSRVSNRDDFVTDQSAPSSTSCLTPTEAIELDVNDFVGTNASSDEASTPSGLNDRTSVTSEIEVLSSKKIGSVRNLTRRKRAVSLLFKRRGTDPAPSSRVDETESSRLSNRDDFVTDQSAKSSTSCLTPTEAIELDVNDFVGTNASREDASTSTPSLNTEVDGDAPEAILSMLSFNSSQTNENVSEVKRDNARLNPLELITSSVDSFWQSGGANKSRLSGQCTSNNREQKSSILDAVGRGGWEGVASADSFWESGVPGTKPCLETSPLGVTSSKKLVPEKADFMNEIESASECSRQSKDQPKSSGLSNLQQSLCSFPGSLQDGAPRSDAINRDGIKKVSSPDSLCNSGLNDVTHTLGCNRMDESTTDEAVPVSLKSTASIGSPSSVPETQESKVESPGGLPGVPQLQLTLSKHSSQLRIDESTSSLDSFWGPPRPGADDDVDSDPHKTDQERASPVAEAASIVSATTKTETPSATEVESQSPRCDGQPGKFESSVPFEQEHQVLNTPKDVSHGDTKKVFTGQKLALRSPVEAGIEYLYQDIRHASDTDVKKASALGTSLRKLKSRAKLFPSLKKRKMKSSSRALIHSVKSDHIEIQRVPTGAQEETAATTEAREDSLVIERKVCQHSVTASAEKESDDGKLESKPVLNTATSCGDSVGAASLFDGEPTEEPFFSTPQPSEALHGNDTVTDTLEAESFDPSIAAVESAVPFFSTMPSDGGTAHLDVTTTVEVSMTSKLEPSSQNSSSYFYNASHCGDGRLEESDLSRVEQEHHVLNHAEQVLIEDPAATCTDKNESAALRLTTDMAEAEFEHDFLCNDAQGPTLRSPVEAGIEYTCEDIRHDGDNQTRASYVEKASTFGIFLRKLKFCDQLFPTIKKSKAKRLKDAVIQSGHIEVQRVPTEAREDTPARERKPSQDSVDMELENRSSLVTAGLVDSMYTASFTGKRPKTELVLCAPQLSEALPMDDIATSNLDAESVDKSSMPIEITSTEEVAHPVVNKSRFEEANVREDISTAFTTETNELEMEFEEACQNLIDKQRDGTLSDSMAVESRLDKAGYVDINTETNLALTFANGVVSPAGESGSDKENGATSPRKRPIRSVFRLLRRRRPKPMSIDLVDRERSFGTSTMPAEGIEMEIDDYVAATPNQTLINSEDKKKDEGNVTHEAASINDALSSAINDGAHRSSSSFPKHRVLGLFKKQQESLSVPCSTSEVAQRCSVARNDSLVAEPIEMSLEDCILTKSSSVGESSLRAVSQTGEVSVEALEISRREKVPDGTPTDICTPFEVIEMSADEFISSKEMPKVEARSSRRKSAAILLHKLPKDEGNETHEAASIDQALSSAINDRAYQRSFSSPQHRVLGLFKKQQESLSVPCCTSEVAKSCSVARSDSLVAEPIEMNLEDCILTKSSSVGESSLRAVSQTGEVSVAALACSGTLTVPDGTPERTDMSSPFEVIEMSANEFISSREAPKVEACSSIRKSAAVVLHKLPKDEGNAAHEEASIDEALSSGIDVRAHQRSSSSPKHRVLGLFKKQQKSVPVPSISSKVAQSCSVAKSGSLVSEPIEMSLEDCIHITSSSVSDSSLRAVSQTGEVSVATLECLGKETVPGGTSERTDISSPFEVIEMSAGKIISSQETPKVEARSSRWKSAAVFLHLLPKDEGNASHEEASINEASIDQALSSAINDRAYQRSFSSPKHRGLGLFKKQQESLSVPCSTSEVAQSCSVARSDSLVAEPIEMNLEDCILTKSSSIGESRLRAVSQTDELSVAALECSGKESVPDDIADRMQAVNVPTDISSPSEAIEMSADDFFSSEEVPKVEVRSSTKKPDTTIEPGASESGLLPPGKRASVKSTSQFKPSKKGVVLMHSLPKSQRRFKSTVAKSGASKEGVSAADKMATEESAARARSKPKTGSSRKTGVVLMHSLPKSHEKASGLTEAPHEKSNSNKNDRSFKFNGVRLSRFIKSTKGKLNASERRVAKLSVLSDTATTVRGRSTSASPSEAECAESSSSKTKTSATGVNRIIQPVASTESTTAVGADMHERESVHSSETCRDDVSSAHTSESCERTSVVSTGSMPIHGNSNIDAASSVRDGLPLLPETTATASSGVKIGAKSSDEQLYKGRAVSLATKVFREGSFSSTIGEKIRGMKLVSSGSDKVVSVSGVPEKRTLSTRNLYDIGDQPNSSVQVPAVESTAADLEQSEKLFGSESKQTREQDAVLSARVGEDLARKGGEESKSNATNGQTVNACASLHVNDQTADDAAPRDLVQPEPSLSGAQSPSTSTTGSVKSGKRKSRLPPRPPRHVNDSGVSCDLVQSAAPTGAALSETPSLPKPTSGSAKSGSRSSFPPPRPPVRFNGRKTVESDTPCESEATNALHETPSLSTSTRNSFPPPRPPICATEQKSAEDDIRCESVPPEAANAVSGAQSLSMLRTDSFPPPRPPIRINDQNTSIGDKCDSVEREATTVLSEKQSLSTSGSGKSGPRIRPPPWPIRVNDQNSKDSQSVGTVKMSSPQVASPAVSPIFDMLKAGLRKTHLPPRAIPSDAPNAALSKDDETTTTKESNSTATKEEEEEEEEAGPRVCVRHPPRSRQQIA